MRFKKCGFLFSLIMVICFAIPNFASAESNTDVSKGILNGKEFSSSTSRYDLGGSYSIDSLYIFGRNTSASGGHLSVRLYNSKNQQVWYGTGYEFKYLGSSHPGDEYKPSVKKDDVRYIEVSIQGGGRIVTFRALGTEYIPEISNLKAIADYKKVTLSWENPANNNNALSTKLYQDGKEIKTFNLRENITSYVVENLEEGKNYTFKMSVIDNKGRETTGKTQTIRTLMPVIDPPKNVFLTPQDKKIVVAWDDVKSPFLKGYNVYVDGKKINKEPLISSKLIVKNLENDKAYKIQVSAVNKIDAEGKRSEEKTETPSSDALEVEYDVKVPFDAKEALTVAMVFIMIVAPFILLGFALKFYKPIITLLYNSIQKKK